MAISKRFDSLSILRVSAIALLLIFATCAAHAEPWVICIDPGHQSHANHEQEPIGPDAAQTKPKVSAGTAGSLSGREFVVVLDVGLRLRDLLEDAGTSVVMTRTTHDVNIPNSKRAQIANAAHADLFIRLHCNGSRNPDTNGCFTLYPENIPGWTDDIYEQSLLAARVLQPIYAAKTGIPDSGIRPRRDISGFNWSDVPVVLVEMLHQTNPNEDRLASQPSFRQVMAEALRDGILEALRALSKREPQKTPVAP